MQCCVTHCGVDILRVRGDFDGFKKRGGPDLMYDCTRSLWLLDGQGSGVPRNLRATLFCSSSQYRVST